MGVRNCKEIGENLQKIVKRLLSNDRLVNLLYYQDINALTQPALSDEQKRNYVFNKLIKIIPRVEAKETSQSIIAIKVDNGKRLSSNDEFKQIELAIEVYVPFASWIIKDSNLRPFAILGEIQESLQGKTVNGLGKIEGGDFELAFITDDLTCYQAYYNIITYD